jgi:hypothetical protein
MKTRTGLVVALLTFLAVAGFARQNLKVTLYTGYTLSAFEGQESAAGTLPLAISIGAKANPALEVGGEFVYPLGGYQFELQGLAAKVTTTINQMMAGAYGKYLLSAGPTKPFLKAGVGYYFGDTKSEIEGGESGTYKVDGAIGFNVGGGIQFRRGLSLGFTYNIVTREDAGMNTWAVLVGYPIVR